VTKRTQETVSSEITAWIEDALIYIRKREDFEKDDPLLITLYRYIGVLHRIKNPMGSKHEFRVREDLLRKLYQAICDKTVEYFDIKSDV